MMNFYSILTVGIGGFIGSILRYVSVVLIDKPLNSVFPLGTFFVNIFGSFVLGVVIGMNLKHPSGSFNWKLFLTTGFCGGFTTFSTFAFENVNLAQQKFIPTSVVYIAASVVLGLVAVVAGLWIGKQFAKA
jgi:fluoride exporter